VTWLARFGGEAFAQFEIASVKQGRSFRLDQRHRAAENVAGGKEADCVGCVIAGEVTPLAPIEDMFDTSSSEARLHQLRGRRAENNLTMIIDVIGVRMTDEDAFGFWFVGIEPQAELREIHSAAMEFDLQR
jgi:hypothetical protein